MDDGTALPEGAQPLTHRHTGHTATAATQRIHTTAQQYIRTRTQPTHRHPNARPESTAIHPSIHRRDPELRQRTGNNIHGHTATTYGRQTTTDGHRNQRAEGGRQQESYRKQRAGQRKTRDHVTETGSEHPRGRTSTDQASPRTGKRERKSRTETATGRTTTPTTAGAHDLHA